MAVPLVAVVAATWLDRRGESRAARSPRAADAARAQPMSFSRSVPPASTVPAATSFDEIAWAARWRELVASPDVNRPAREARLLALLDELAGRDPLRALALADIAPSHAARLRWRGAALRRWAQTDAGAAADWIARWLDNHPDARDAALGAVIEGAAAQADPHAALALLRRLEHAYPAAAEAHRGGLVAAWASHGAFQAAAAFALSARDEERADLLDSVFGTWVRERPAQAARTALHLPDRIAREQAWRSVVAGWATADPAALARFAATLPQPEARAEALGQALPHWFLRDAGQATAWMDRLEPGADLDSGAACVASFAPLVRLRPDVALGWAEGIVNPELRRTILADVVQAWAGQDPEAARRYAIRQGLPGAGR